MCTTAEGRGTSYGLSIRTLLAGDPRLVLVNDEAINGVIFFAQMGDPPVSEECLSLALHVFCSLVVPPCNPATGLPMLYCENSCRLYNQLRENSICNELDIRLNAAAERPIFASSRLISFLMLYDSFNCSDPTSYFYMDVPNPDPELCTSMFTPDTEGKLKYFFIASL